MKYFTSDWHIGEDRIGGDKPNLFYRPFGSIEEQDYTIMRNMSMITDDDELFVIGDVVYNNDFIHVLSELSACKKTLIIGNYDEDKIEQLKFYFDEIKSYKTITLGDYRVELNHYPKTCLNIVESSEDIDFGITGHVHGLWKVQKDLINVSVDAWHFKPVSEKEILFCYNAMENYYDDNVFPYNNLKI